MKAPELHAGAYTAEVKTEDVKTYVLFFDLHLISGGKLDVERRETFFFVVFT